MVRRAIDRPKLKADLSLLLRQGPLTAPELRQRLGISQPTLHRLITSASAELMAVGRTQSTRYVARRTISEVGKELPIYEVMDDGRSRHFATLHAIYSKGFYLEPVGEEMQVEELYPDLPYFLNDLRPAGYLGSLLPLRHPELELPRDVRRFTVEDCLRYLVRFGSDHIGSFIVGNEAFERYLQHAHSPENGIALSDRPQAYRAIVNDVLAFGDPGSSAGGEQPKFLATLIPDMIPVLVKFSPLLDTAVGRRVSDLLVCEHIALNTLSAAGKLSAKSVLITTDERTFLEVERFDRLPSFGRRGLISLAALDSQFLGTANSSWSQAVASLAALKIVPEESVSQVHWLELFGRLIGNSDMHQGNLSFITRGLSVLAVAPAYDMLPMFFAPRNQQLIDQPFIPPNPTPADAVLWQEVWQTALRFWDAVATDPRITSDFRRLARSCHNQVEALDKIARLLPR